MNAQPDQGVFFEHISSSEGLSHIGVNTIFQDSKGFLWIGTYDGLNRYDGLNFRIFHHIPTDSTSLINNRVKSILESKDGLIWIGTEEGLCFYNQSTERFGTLNLGDFPYERINVVKIYEDAKQRLWILETTGNIYIIHKDRQSFKNIYYQDNSSDLTQFYDISSGPEGSHLLASSTGMVMVNSALELDLKPLRNRYSDQIFRSITIQNDTLAWLGSETGLILTKIKHNDRQTDLIPIKTFLPQLSVRSILIDNEFNVWAATSENGLNKISFEDGEYRIQTFRNNPASIHSISSDRLRCLFEDREGILWIGSAESGLNKYNLSSHVFHNLNMVNTGTYGPGSDIILSFLQMSDKNILVGTREKGIYTMDGVSNRFIPSAYNFNLVKDKSVSSLFIDSRNILWVRTWEGLYNLIPGNGSLSKIEGIDSEGGGICEDEDGNIWIAVSTGLNKIIPGRDNKITEIKSYVLNFEQADKQIKTRTIYKDPFDNSIWLGTYHKGIIKVELNGQDNPDDPLKFKQYKLEKEAGNSLQSNFVTTILRTSPKDLWIGTEGGGLSHGEINDGELTFTNFSEKDGLSNNVVKAILEDGSGDLWISTNKGLNKFIMKSEQFIIFDNYDGLPSNYFTYAALETSDKRIILGGNKGLTLFNPASIRIDTIPPVPEFGSLQVFYQTVYPLDKLNNKILLENSISETDHLKLAYNQNTFSLELLALHFSNPRANRFRYKLHGFDDEWIYSSKGNTFANYTKVRPGRYTFEFIAANNHGLWSEKSKTIEVSVLPPFWLNRYAILLYVFVFILIIYLIYRNSKRIIGLKHKVRIEEIQKVKNRELNESKLKFFMNVSHEFKTPISLITGPVQWLMKQNFNDRKIRNHLSLIKSQTDYLLNLLDQLVYFRKAESDALELKCQCIDIIPFIEKIKKSYDWQSGEQGIQFNFLHPHSAIPLWVDPKSMDKVFHNLFSNAFKYTKSGGRISISVYPDKQDDLVHISVKDTGIGIASENISRIFNRFYQEDSSVGGYGIGLSLTKSLIELHKGEIKVNSIHGKETEFLLTLRSGKDHLSENQILSEEEIRPSYDQPDTLVQKDQLSGHTRSIDERKNELILIVEDNPRMLSFLRDLLSEEYMLITASNGLDALEAMKSDFPDLILSDVMMPGMDGITLCSKVKTNVLTCHIPVVLLSAKSDVESRIQGLEEGADYYIPKPVDIDLLQAEIRSIVHNRNKIKERIALKLPFENPAEDIHPLDRNLLEKLNAVAEENYENPDFDSKQFSKKLFINRSLFYKKMKALTNQTPAEFLRAFRMNKAVEFMIMEKVPISEVNEKVGILSRSHFTKCFKETYGTLPSQFLQSRIEGKEFRL